MNKIIYITLISILIFSCKNTEHNYIETSGSIYSSTYHVKYCYDKDLSKDIYIRLVSIENSLSFFKPTSILSKVNRNEPIILDSHFIKVFNKAMEVAKATDGYYDVTCAPIISAWGFGSKKIKKDPTQKQIDSLLQFVGYNKIRIQGNIIQKDDPRVTINCSSIVDGYATDVISNYFDSLKIENYMVEICGEIRAKGKNQESEYWRIGLEKPVFNELNLEKEVFEVVELKNQAVSTSGNYHNYRVEDGKIIAHTMNPKTGYPSQNNLLSVSVLENDCITADAYSTAFMVIGKERTEDLLKKHKNRDCILIFQDADKKIISRKIKKD